MKNLLEVSVLELSPSLSFREGKDDGESEHINDEPDFQGDPGVASHKNRAKRLAHEGTDKDERSCVKKDSGPEKRQYD